MRIRVLKNRTQHAFTLTELMIGVAVLILILSGVVAGHLCGLKMFEITRSKLGASDEARKSLSRMVDEVRGAKWLQVGNGTASSFSQIDDGDPQRGTSVEIYSTDSNDPFIRYYLDPSKRTLNRVTSEDSTPEVIAHSITNQIVFAAENAAGTVLTNSENNRVLSLTLQFYQIQYPIVKVGPGQYYDFYQLRTRITRRTLE